MVFGWMFDDYMCVELMVGIGDGYVCYVGCGMDGVYFCCEMFGLLFDKWYFGDVFDWIEVCVYYNEVDYVMDNYMLW